MGKARHAAAEEVVRKYPSLGRLGWKRRKIPVIQQLSATECGAASLAMVLGYLGKEVGLEEVRDVCGSSRDGMNALAILNAGQLLGLRGRGIKVDIKDLHLLDGGTTILHWDFAHFVVLAEVHDRWVDIVDPALGRRRVPMEEFRRSFTGVALVFEPGDLFARQKREGIVWDTIKSLILQSGMLPRIVVISLILQIFGLAMPILMGLLIDRILPRGDLDLLVVILAGLAVLIVFEGIGTLVRGHLLLHLRTVLDTRMTMGFLDHLVSLPYAYFQLRSAGDLMMRLNSNATVREKLTSSTLSAILDGLLVVLYLALLFVGNLAIALAALLVALLDVMVFIVLRRKQHELNTQALAATAKSQGYQVEMLTAMETLKATGNEQRSVSRWSNLFVDSLNVMLDRDRLSVAAEAILSVMRAGGPLIILATGALQVLDGEMSLGSMLSLNAIAGSFLGPLSGLVTTAMSLNLVRSYLERVNDVLQAEPEQHNSNRIRKPGQLSGRVELEQVTFRYGPKGPMVVDGVSLKIEPGQFVAVVGPSGSGKSTLAALIVGLYGPTSGRILFDGIDLAELDLRWLRPQLGIVNQNLALFGTTIRENIALSDPTLGLAEVTEAAQLAAVHEDIMAMPLGYNTPLVDRGGSLSGGQKQRLALARALVRKPALLLLDEATSALDAVTERRVQEALDQLRSTRIVIAHRLSTVKRADLILVMDRGRIVEQGDHQQLIKQSGSYAALVAAQMDGEGRRALAVEREPVGRPPSPPAASPPVASPSAGNWDDSAVTTVRQQQVVFEEQLEDTEPRPQTFGPSSRSLVNLQAIGPDQVRSLPPEKIRQLAAEQLRTMPPSEADRMTEAHLPALAAERLRVMASQALRLERLQREQLGGRRPPSYRS
jgi:ATP-binding cassette, subfamily B, bacterial